MPDTTQERVKGWLKDFDDTGMGQHCDDYYDSQADALLALITEPQEVVAYALDPKPSNWLHESLASAEAEAEWMTNDGKCVTSVRPLTYMEAKTDED